MDSGPFRAPRSAETDRRVPSRESTQRSAEVPQAATEEPKPTYRAVAPRLPEEKKPSRRRFILPAIIGLLLIIVAVFVWSALSMSKQGAVAPVNSARYQAVFSTSGLVYFGKLESLNSEYFKLTKVYYLQQSTTDTATDVGSSDQKLIKLSDAIHGPEDEMIIPKSQVLFYENLKSDSKVAQAIDKDNK